MELTLLPLLALILTEYGLQSRRATIGRLAAAILLMEVGAPAFRRAVRKDLEDGNPHGRVRTHFLPFLIGPLSSIPVSTPLLVERQWRLLESSMAIQVLAILFAFCLLWTWGTMVTVSMVAIARPGEVANDAAPSHGGGELIGILERMLIFVLVLGGGELAAVGFVVAAKSAARFPQFKDPAFAEYFLIGSLTSMGMATAIGLAVKQLLAI